ncbi:MAG TPA: hypothetical protein VMV92_16225 [Streptosporangiaceae bacterium]|nr:hypothetical protein [Streptosporangiaceae bacterium]
MELTTAMLADAAAAGAPSFVPLVIAFSNLIFDVPGRYEWVITADDAELGRVPLEVMEGPVPGC